MKSSYRADIDGLRSLAVLSVVLFHFDFSRFGGGYVGVDIFFVISGYLITGIILREVQSETFSILKFYERRVRRIFPALMVTLALTLAIGFVLSTPSDYDSLGESVAAVTAFASNFLFWKQSGYFDGPAQSKPLLHTWSLAVEEQFYIFFPLALVGIHRFLGSRFRFWLTVAACVSFAGSIWGTYNQPDAAFYLAPTRAWELLLGALIAGEIQSAPQRAMSRNILATLGMALILCGVFFLTPTTSFPGVAALLPTLGTACVIYAGKSGDTVMGRFLSTKPIVFIGLISYSLYLLHWPLLVFAKETAIVELTNYQKLMLLAAIFALSMLSWRFVEVPFRAKGLVNRSRLFVAAGVLMFAAASVGLLIHLRGGLPGRFDSATLANENLSDPQWTRWNDCMSLVPDKAHDLCTLGSPDAKPTLLLWGDSHARAVASTVNDVAARHAAAGYFAARNGCAPILGISRKEQRECLGFEDRVISFVAQRPELTTVVLAARWAWYAEGNYKQERKPAITFADTLERKTGNNTELLRLGLTRTVRRLLAMGRRVVLVDQVPEIGYNVPSAYAIASRTGRDLSNIIAPTRAEYLSRNEGVIQVLSALRELPGVQVLRASDLLCGGSVCQVAESGHALYRDDNHLSTYGADLIASIFEPVFNFSR